MSDRNNHRADKTHAAHDLVQTKIHSVSVPPGSGKTRLQSINLIACNIQASKRPVVSVAIGSFRKSRLSNAVRSAAELALPA